MKEQKLFIKTYGCQMNIYDSERMATMLAMHGYSMAKTLEEANLVLLNTCHIREKATEKVFSELGRIKPLKESKRKKGETLNIAVAGCTAQAEGKEIGRRAPYVDLIVGPQSYHELPEMLEQLKRKKKNGSGAKQAVGTAFSTIEKFDALNKPHTHKGPTAFLTIQEGCDKFCHFCVVPYTRGAEFSRSVDAIIEEAQRLVDQGAIEITLLGQNVNAYHGTYSKSSKEINLGRLCYELAQHVPGIKSLRYITCHPRDVHNEQIEAHRDIDILQPFLHLPIQSGSDEILKRMNRKHTVANYISVIERFRAAQPKIAFSSDFIVGYPGETKQHFLETLQLVQDVFFAQAFSFKYSIRPGTSAGFLEDQLSEEEKGERLQMLQQLLGAQQLKFNKDLYNTTTPALFDRQGKEPGSYIGRTPYLQPVHVVSNKNILGKILPVYITHAGPNSLNGKL